MTIQRSTYAVTKDNTVGNTAMTLEDFGFSAGDVAAADRATICVTANALRLTWDHPTVNPPTNSTGLRLPTNNYPLFEVVGQANIRYLQMIRDSSSDATVTITLEQD